MANKSPAELKSEGAELKAVLAKVKKKQHNCAILMSKDGIVMEVHLKKSPEVLLKAAKKAGGMAKGAWGTATMEGQVLIIDPINDKIPGSLAKVAKKYFSERGLKNRLEIKEPDEDGAATEAAPAEEESAAPARGGAQETEAVTQAPAANATEEDTAPATGQGDSQEAPEGGGQEEADPRVALEERLEELQPRIDALLADVKSLMIDGVKDTMGLFTRAMDDELFDRANEALGKVTTVLDDYDGLMAQKQPFLDRMSSMVRDVASVVSGKDDSAATAIARFQREFEYAVENNEWFSSGEKLDQIEALIGEFRDADDEPEAEDGAEAEDGGAAGTQEPEDTEDPSATENDGDERRRLVDAFKALTSHIKTALKSDDKGLVKKIATLAKGFAIAVKSGDFAKSQKIIDLLESLVGQGSENAQERSATENEAPATPQTESGQSTEPSEGEATADPQAKGNRLKQLKRMRSSLDSLLKEMQP